MDDKQLDFLSSLEDIDWTSEINAKTSSSLKSATKVPSLLSKSQKKRAKKHLKKAGGGVHSKNSKNVETVVFENPDKLTTSSSSATKSRKNRNADDGEGIDIDLKKARFEVMKFSMNSLSGNAKYDAETALAISLGAREGKKDYVNYKDLIVTRKEEKRKVEEEELIKAKSKPKPKDKKRKKGTGSGPSEGIVRIKNVNSFLNQKKTTKRKR